MIEEQVLAEWAMASISLDEKNITGTAMQGVPVASILEQTGEVLKQAPEYPGKVPNPVAVKGQEYAQGRTNMMTRSLASHTARKLFILFDIAFAILLIVLLGDEEDDLRLHPAFIRSTQAWRKL